MRTHTEFYSIGEIFFNVSVKDTKIIEAILKYFWNQQEYSIFVWLKKSPMQLLPAFRTFIDEIRKAALKSRQ